MTPLAANPAAAKGGPERKHDMSSQIPFTPVTPEALARLTPAERDAFTTAAEQLAGSQKPSMMTIVTLVETVQRLIAVPDEIRRLEIAVAAGDALIREILEALCQRDGQSLESSVVPGEPARNYDLALRLGIGHVFGIKEPPQERDGDHG